MARVAVLFRQRTRAEWTAFAEHTDCCLEPLLDVSEAYAHPQVRARHLAQGGGAIPRLGEHTRAILERAQCTAREIEEWARAGLLGL
jgi:hypothetical protein